MFDSATSRPARILLAFTAATTVGLTGLSGAAQADHRYGHDHDRYRDVEVTVCKTVNRYDGEHHDRGNRRADNDHRRASFHFSVRADGYHRDFSLGRNRCRSFDVDRGDRVTIREHRARGYELRDIYVSGGARNVRERHNSVSFRAHHGDIDVTFVNHRRDRDDWNDDSHRRAV